jgi:hypothetical protein
MTVKYEYIMDNYDRMEIIMRAQNNCVFCLFTALFAQCLFVYNI